MRLTVPSRGRPAIFDVTFVHEPPPLRVTCTRPSSLPTQMRPFSRGDSATAKIVVHVSTPVLSPVIGPPDHFCRSLSLVVRSGLMTAHVWPPSVDRNSTCAA